MGEKERVINDKLQKLIKRIKNADWKDCDRPYMARLAKERINELQQRGVYCVDRFVRRLLASVTGKEAYLDILMEGRFAIILARNGFKEIHIEYCSEGPDIKTEYNRQTVYFEVTRRHTDEDEWTGEYGAAGPSPDRPENVIDRIWGKLGQLKSGGTNIVVLWSDTVKLGKPDVEEAFKYIQQEICHHPKYGDLSGVLLTEGGGVDLASLKQFYLFENDRVSKPLGTRLRRKLESLRERDLKEWQKELEDLTAAVKQLKAKRNL